MADEQNTVESQVTPQAVTPAEGTEPTYNQPSELLRFYQNKTSNLGAAPDTSVESENPNSNSTDVSQPELESVQATIPEQSSVDNQAEVKPEPTKSYLTPEEYEARLNEMKAENVTLRQIFKERYIDTKVNQSEQPKQTNGDYNSPQATQVNETIKAEVNADGFTKEEQDLIDNDQATLALNMRFERNKKEAIAEATNETLNKIVSLSKQATEQNKKQERAQQELQSFYTKYPDLNDKNFAPIISSSAIEIINSKSPEERMMFEETPSLFFDEIASKARDTIRSIRGVQANTVQTPPSFVKPGALPPKPQEQKAESDQERLLDFARRKNPW